MKEPAPIIITDDAGELQAALPSYAKGHSQGEYVFDHSWADALERAAAAQAQAQAQAQGSSGVAQTQAIEAQVPQMLEETVRQLSGGAPPVNGNVQHTAPVISAPTTVGNKTVKTDLKDHRGHKDQRDLKDLKGHRVNKEIKVDYFMNLILILQ